MNAKRVAKAKVRKVKVPRGTGVRGNYLILRRVRALEGEVKNLKATIALLDAAVATFHDQVLGNGDSDEGGEEAIG